MERHVSTNPLGTLVNADEDLIFESTHGDYSWVLDFFRFNYANANHTLEALHKEFGELNVIERVEDVRRPGLIECFSFGRGSMLGTSIRV